jgi:hypothetical protein
MRAVVEAPREERRRRAAAVRRDALARFALDNVAGLWEETLIACLHRAGRAPAPESPRGAGP